MTLNEMFERKRELGLTNADIADQSGIPLPTVQKIFAGITRSPRRETIEALTRVLKPAAHYKEGEASGQMVCEAAPVYSAKKEYTLEDYLALPDDQRVELIDGQFYDMAAPTTVHQSIGGYIYKKLLDHVLEHKGPCYPFISPVDVQLDCDDRTVVQPDVMIICDRDKYKNGRIFGAPDFIVEILSPSTKKKDMYLKLMKYHNAGVREYWMADPSNKTIIVHNLELELPPVIYSFDDTIPVAVWDGKCVIDFKEIYENTSFLWEL